MSRNIKDLRELICVSRLSLRDSDDDSEGRDYLETRDYLTRPYSVVSQYGPPPDTGYVEGMGTPRSPVSPQDPQPLPTPPPSGERRSTDKKRRKRKVKPPVEISIGHELPRLAPLPPLGDGNLPPRPETARMKSGHFDDILMYLDATIVATWLGRANDGLDGLTNWVLHEDHFVQFAHFWMSEFVEQQRQDIFKMEYDILVDEMTLAFTVGRENGNVKLRDVHSLLAALFREYPRQLLSSNGTYLFLDYLDVLTSERRTVYKKILSDVKVTTRNKQFAQWILATRSFALVNVWMAIVGFYRKLSEGRGAAANNLPLPSSLKKRAVLEQRLYHAIRSGYVDVLQYLVRAGHVAGTWEDNHQRTLVFLAAMHSQPAVVTFIASKVRPPPDVNQASDSGNTALHAAVNKGHVETVRSLLRYPGLRVDATNPQCDAATPLHLAVMHGHLEIAEMLLNAGANPSLAMGDLTALQIAEDFGHEAIVPALKRHWPYTPESASIPGRKAEGTDSSVRSRDTKGGGDNHGGARPKDRTRIEEASSSRGSEKLNMRGAGGSLDQKRRVGQKDELAAVAAANPNLAEGAKHADLVGDSGGEGEGQVEVRTPPAEGGVVREGSSDEGLPASPGDLSTEDEEGEEGDREADEEARTIMADCLGGVEQLFDSLGSGVIAGPETIGGVPPPGFAVPAAASGKSGGKGVAAGGR